MPPSKLETDMSPVDLLLEVKRLEVALGRGPQERRWGPRVIDIDILSFDGLCVTDTEHDLIVPHPRFHERRFALEPVAELDPLLLPWRNCADLRVDVSVSDLLPMVVNQEVQRVGGPDGRIRSRRARTDDEPPGHRVLSPARRH